MTTPKRGIGHQTLQSLGVFASQYKLSLFEALFSSSLPSVLNARAVGSLHEFGRYVNDLEFRARHTVGAEDARAFLTEWLKDIGYEKHLYDSEDNEKVVAARWTNVLDFCDWMAQRCGGQIDDAAGVTTATERKNLLEVAQKRGQDAVCGRLYESDGKSLSAFGRNVAAGSGPPIAARPCP